MKGGRLGCCKHRVDCAVEYCLLLWCILMSFACGEVQRVESMGHNAVREQVGHDQCGFREFRGSAWCLFGVKFR